MGEGVGKFSSGGHAGCNLSNGLGRIARTGGGARVALTGGAAGIVHGNEIVVPFFGHAPPALALAKPVAEAACGLSENPSGEKCALVWIGKVLLIICFVKSIGLLSQPALQPQRYKKVIKKCREKYCHPPSASSIRPAQSGKINSDTMCT